MADVQTDAEHEVLIEATPEEIWEALTSDDGLDDWLGEGTEVDPVPGGEIATPDVVTDRPRRGHVDEVDPARRFAFTWWPEDDHQDRSQVTITLVPTRAGTLVRVVERSIVGVPAAIGRMATAGSTTPAPAFVDWAWRASLVGVRASGSVAAR
ncbi:MAG: SRPBCC domain-containing protein [Actinomycetota bacterium]